MMKLYTVNKQVKKYYILLLWRAINLIATEEVDAKRLTTDATEEVYRNRSVAFIAVGC